MAEEPEIIPQTFVQKLLFYTTAFFILLGTFSLFAFLFLVPFVIDPAFTTIFMQFDPEPALCETVDSEWKKGASNCTWSSCREGCTKEVYDCTQIRVNYKLGSPPEVEEAEAVVEEESGTERIPRAIRDYNYLYDDVSAELKEEAEPRTGLTGDPTGWFYLGAKLYPNVKGCGYPPMLNCSVFIQQYHRPGTNFSCYYSKVDPGLVISHLDMHQVYMNLVYAMAIPIPSFIVSVIYLTFAYFVIYNEEPEEALVGGAAEGDGDPDEATPVPPALTPGSDAFREDLASFGHQLKVAMADDLSRDSIAVADNGTLSKSATTPAGSIADV